MHNNSTFYDKVLPVLVKYATHIPSTPVR